MLTYRYKFTLSNGTEKEFTVKLDDKTLNLISEEKKSYPEWTELKYSKCSNCPLNENQHKFCPLAINLVDLIDFFSGSNSYEEVDIYIETEARKYTKHTTLQQGISSLMGIYMVTTGCPIMEKLKPMVRFHLPFATIDETKYRVLSMYLLAQYFLARHGKEPDWELKKLVEIYADIQTVNKNFCKRLRNIKIKDASINAVVILDCFAGSVTFSLEEDALDKIELLFNAYLE
ncbi:MAG: hypothetical protein COY53_00400 [Elusimicrobia bacterium CG_4_10_14_0_8_um_filter_37_32]|nr:MAG: hypothetical protein COS17_06235 [Elusimicrobia bacterium CG02_land_8_20_14_3_00_37_13]PIZ14320.1 MAG: hypothetical protein COY53_00400 [Elusimicrobia bacterium CG_4_10_14_0_8_um_filter_37_32]